MTMNRLAFLFAFTLISTACTVNMVDKEIIRQAYVPTGDAKKIHISLESNFDYGVITLRPLISGDYQRLSITTVKETRQEKYVAGSEIIETALVTAVWAGLPLVLLFDEDYTWFSCGATATCSEKSEAKTEERRIDGQVVQPIPFKPSEVSLSISTRNGVNLSLPLDADGFATTTLRELGYPKKFSVELVYRNQTMVTNLESPQHYLSTVDTRTIQVVSASGKRTKATKVRPSAELFKELDNLVEANMQRYMKSVSKPYIPAAPVLPLIAKPVFPPAPTLVKSDFETRADFQKRVQVALEERGRVINSQTQSYQEQVESRNKEMRKVMTAYNNNLVSLTEHYKKRRALLQKSLADEQEIQLLLAFPEVFGKPALQDLQYAAEQQVVYANLTMVKSDYKQAIWWEMPNKMAQKLFENQQAIEIDSEFSLSRLTYNSASRALQLKKVFIDYENSNYEPAIEQVAYLPQDYRVVPDLGLLAAQEALKLNDLEPSPALAELSIQSAELIEQLQLSAADYVQEQESYVGKFRFNDDIPTLLAKASPNSINRHRRLIVIGIENYRYTHPVAFSRRSAELFVQVAQKTLGVSAENTLSLIDYDATSGAMKDSLRLFLKDIDEQDEIVFYYSGHGIPDPGDRNEPYILPIDKAPSYVSEDKAFQLAHMYKQLSDSGANKIVAIIDSCFSGVSDGKSLFEGVAAARLVPRIADFDKKKMVVLTAGKGDQFSNMYKEKGNRLFSYYVMKSLLKGRTDVETLYQEVSVQVKDVSRGIGLLYKQEPEIRGNTLLKL